MAMTGLDSGHCTEAFPHVQTIGRPEDVMQRKSSFNAFVDAGGGVSTVAHPTVKMYVPLEFPVRSEIVARDRSGRIHLRHTLDLMGWVHLPELRIDFVFRRQEQDKQDPADRWATATIVPPGFRLPIPAQTLDRTDPARRDLWVMTSDPGRQPPWLHYYAGACEQHILTFSRPVHGRATLDVSCRCHEEENETKVDVWGNVAFERSTSMRVTLKDGSRGQGPRPMEGKEMVIISSGTRIPIERQRLAVVVGRRPWISMRVSDGDGRVLCSEHELGYSGEDRAVKWAGTPAHRPKDSAADVTDPI